MMRYKHVFVIAACFLMLGSVLSGCAGKGNSLTDGYYTAEMAEYDNGWREFVTIHVEGGEISSVEYNAKNASGFIKSWDMQYMRKMSAAKGTYPNYYTRTYARQVVERQSGDSIDTVAGASNSGGKFRLMIAAALAQAQTGNTQVAIVEMT